MAYAAFPRSERRVNCPLAPGKHAVKRLPSGQSERKKKDMKLYKIPTGPMALALVMGGYLLAPSAANAKVGETDSAEINRLLADAKTEAVGLKSDADNMVTLTRADVNWQSYADKIVMIKEHVNNTGKLLVKLENAKAEGAPWQQTAIERIAPLLREMATNTTATITYLNENRAKVHFSDFKDYLTGNFDVATNLEAMIRNFVDYGNTQEKYRDLGKLLEITG